MKTNAIIILSLLLKLAVSIQPIPDADDQLHIYALPVGQGDCTVIQCPRAANDPVKGTVSIIDAGSSKMIGINRDDIVDFLARTELQFVVITHSDKDHINYMDTILNYYKKKVPVFHSCNWNNHYKNYITSQYADPEEIPHCMNIKDCWDKLNLCPNYQPSFGTANSVTLSFVASAVGGCAGNRANNEDSLISKITYAGRSTLITGDFELPLDKMTNFLKKAGPDLSSHIYRLSHHGAYNKEANQKVFLDAVSASYVFSSSGFMHGHPRCEIYDYYDNRLPNNVPAHPYTCYKHLGFKKYDHVPRETRKPIYVTSVYKEWLLFTRIYHLIVEFDINELGVINAKWEYLL